MAHTASNIDEILGLTPTAPSTALAVSKPSLPSALAAFYREAAISVKPKDSKDAGITIASVVAGGYLFRKKAPVLGAIGLGALGHFGPGLLREEDRKTSLRSLAVIGGGIGGARLMKGSPFLGAALGILGGGLAAYYGVK